MSELAESVESINEQLVREYGTEMMAGSLPRFRVVFSDDQFEHRWITHTKKGLELANPVVKEVPKYKHYIKGKYILERLLPVFGETDLVTKTSYEPAWVFVDSKGNYLPPQYWACQIVIDSLLEASGRKSGHAKYRDPDVSLEDRKARIDKVYKELFGNETAVGDALAHGYGVTVPENKLLNETGKLEN